MFPSEIPLVGVTVSLCLYEGMMDRRAQPELSQSNAIRSSYSVPVDIALKRLIAEAAGLLMARLWRSLFLIDGGLSGYARSSSPTRGMCRRREDALSCPFDSRRMNNEQRWREANMEGISACSSGLSGGACCCSRPQKHITAFLQKPGSSSGSVTGETKTMKKSCLPVTYVLVVDGFGHERDSQDDDTGDNEQDDGEVEVVDSTDDGGTVTGVNAAACPKSKLSNHPGQADKKADYGHEDPSQNDDHYKSLQQGHEQ
ncbi:hypothetical protein EYF80_018426 [Liparis tanakae]|uniref:Uncharacterized protein n=1 Tax=Liparis tanakae TaxID=230148 RepID=A0A4Z2I0C8_9TELE|nr:hypothetical protein EYF80_018426 [Liparis tanakae]